MMVVDEDARAVERQGAEGAEAAILPIQRQGGALGGEAGAGPAQRLAQERGGALRGLSPQLCQS